EGLFVGGDVQAPRAVEGPPAVEGPLAVERPRAVAPAITEEGTALLQGRPPLRWCETAGQVRAAWAEEAARGSLPGGPFGQRDPVLLQAFAQRREATESGP